MANVSKLQIKEEPFIPISEERGFLAQFGKPATVILSLLYAILTM
jgi:hypothetical protein